MESSANVSARDSDELALPGVLVTTSWLAEHLDDAKLRILDVREPAYFVRSHIAGARNAPLANWACTIDGVEGMVLPADAYAGLMSQLGVTRDTPVVMYDDTWGLAAARLFWSLEYYGHRAIAVLDGGWDFWRAEGLPLEAGTAGIVPAPFSTQPEPLRIATYTWLRERLERGYTAADGLAVVDVRSPAEYAEGHLPGAISWDWMNATLPSSWEVMRDAAELSAELEEIGVTRDKEIVVYCRSGVRAAHTYLVLRALGYPRVRNYDGSWLEWEARTAASARSSGTQSVKGAPA